MNYLSLTAFFFLFFTTQIFSSEIVVTAERIRTSKSQTGSSISVIGTSEIEKSGAMNVYDLLRTVPGLNVSNTGGVGQTTVVNMRGTNAAHVLVLIDGIEANDPMSTGKTFDFAFLDTSNIERIEVLRGSQSVLYGSDAIGGVIHIITKKGQKNDSKVSLEYGSYNHRRATVNLRNKFEKLKYSFTIDKAVTDGISAASGGTEDDGSDNTTINGNIHYKISKKNSLVANSRYVYNESDADDTSSATSVLIDDPYHEIRTEQFFNKLQYQHLFSTNLDTKTDLSLTRYNRVSTNKPDSNNSNNFRRNFNSSILKVAHQSDLIMSQSHTTSVGLEYEIETGRYKDEYGSLPEKQLYTAGIYAQQYSKYKNLFGSIGARVDQHQTFGNQFSYKISPGMNLNKITIKSNLSSGFKAPNLYQLFSSFGNPDLEPEESLSFDFGYDHKIKENFTYSITYFKTKIKNLITFPSTQYVNIGTVHSKGLETSLNYHQKNLFEFDTAYTRTLTEASGLYLYRVPNYTVSSKLRFKKLSLITPTLEYFYKGRRDDVDSNNSSGPRIGMPSYALWNFHLDFNYQTTRLWLKIHNVFDKQYEDIDGYSAAGTTLTLGYSKHF